MAEEKPTSKTTAPAKKAPAKPKPLTAKLSKGDRVIPTTTDVRICVIDEVTIDQEAKTVTYTGKVEKTGEPIMFSEHKDNRKIEKSQATEHMEKVIEAYINKLAKVDPLFQKKVNNPAKNIDDCMTYIINTVDKSGKNGFADSEIFGMAIHYYDEDGLDIGSRKSVSNVMVNHVVELTEEEIAEKKKEALEKVFKDEEDRLKKKRNKPAKPTPTVKVEAKTEEGQASLF